MKRLRLFIVLFGLALAVPVTYFVSHSFQGLENEELEELRYFAETLLDRMEGELQEIVRREEARAADAYAPSPVKDSVVGQQDDLDAGKQDSLAQPPGEPYVLGYFQNSPDGSLQTPTPIRPGSREHPEVPAELERLNSLFNNRRLVSPASEPEPAASPALAALPPPEKLQKKSGLGSRYLRSESPAKQKATLGREEKRVEEITIAQARNIAQDSFSDRVGAKMESAVEPSRQAGKPRAPAQALSMAPAPSMLDEAAPLEAEADDRLVAVSGRGRQRDDKVSEEGRAHFEGVSEAEMASDAAFSGQKSQAVLQVEVDPLQSVQLDEHHLFLFRRIVIDGKVYRQGMVIKIDEFLEYLGNKYFIGQPLADFTRLRLTVATAQGEVVINEFGSEVKDNRFELNRTFPRPFSFLRATMTCEEIPTSTSRRTLVVMMSVLALVVLLGLFSIYQCAWVQVDLSRRRSGFVSSVTHELKTPLTNIRMYIEMLEQGIAGDKEREKEYFRILGSESARLTRLINNVLEFSRLENRQRRFSRTKGSLDEVIDEVDDVMKVKLQQEGFTLHVRREEVPPFGYDREAMVQILINLIDNAVKFGRDSAQKEITLWIRQEGEQVKISVSDTGSGIPADALLKVFDDFYRVDNSLTRKTSGTGIGLALVKKFCQAMGGSVSARNNDGPGCTVTVIIPLQTP